MPSAEQISKMISQKMATLINDCGKNEAIAKWSSLAQNIGYEVRFLTDSLSDGKLDKEEIEQMANRLKPTIEKLLALI